MWKVSRSSNDELVCSGRSLAAKAFRWNSLDSDEILVRLPWCVLGNCINPFHFARDNRKNLEGSDLDSTPDSGSLETFDNCKSRRFEESFLTHVPLPLNDSAPDPTEERWAICMFWEGKNRIGRTFSVDRRYFSVFGSLVDEDGLCLSSLPNTGVVGRVRDKVGGGVVIWKSQSHIWIYNRDNTSSAFVHANQFGDDPVKLKCGSCLCLSLESKCITVSLVKGWGKRYRRQDVTDCPAWLEFIVD